MTTVVTRDEGEVRWISFNRPEKLNTLLLEDLQAALEAVRTAAASTRVLVFTGTGDRAFSAGVNLETFLLVVSDPDAARDQIGAVRALLDAVRTCELPTIAAINGACLGGAFELALACDFRIATAGALLGLPEIKLGLPCILDSALLQQYVGLNLAKEMMLVGDLYSAERMEREGLLSVVADGAALTAAVHTLTDRLTPLSAVGIASQKRLFETWQNEPLGVANDVSLDEIVGVFKDPDTQRRLVDYSRQLAARSRA